MANADKNWQVSTPGKANRNRTCGESVGTPREATAPSTAASPTRIPWTIRHSTSQSGVQARAASSSAGHQVNGGPRRAPAPTHPSSRSPPETIRAKRQRSRHALPSIAIGSGSPKRRCDSAGCRARGRPSRPCARPTGTLQADVAVVGEGGNQVRTLAGRLPIIGPPHSRGVPGLRCERRLMQMTQ
jgi:hypothetical protein